jgi:uncharacterized protein
MQNKYSEHGYIKLWIPNSPNREHQRAIQQLIAHPDDLRREFERIFDEEKQP